MFSTSVSSGIREYVITNSAGKFCGENCIISEFTIRDCSFKLHDFWHIKNCIDFDKESSYKKHENDLNV